MVSKLDRSALFSLNSFAAAMLALYIGFALGLPRPYWAMTTAYIVSQPLSGAVRSKAVYRVLGTLLGGAVSVALVPALVNVGVDRLSCPCAVLILLVMRSASPATVSRRRKWWWMNCRIL